MATSPLVAATKPVGSSAEEQTPAEANYQVAMQRILDALDAREGRNQQDIYLALAQGMLTPGKTGSFGESVGQAAGNVRDVQRQQDKELLENAQMRLQIAQAGREQANLTSAQRAFQQKAGLPVAGARPGATPADGAVPAGGAPEMKTVSVQDALEFIAAYPNQKELGARMMEAAKAGLDRYSQAMNGIVFDKMTGKYLNMQDIPGQTQSDYATPYGTYKMTPNEYSRFNFAQQTGLGKQWMDAFKKGEHFGVDQLVAQKLEGKPVGGLPTAATPPASKPAAETPPTTGAAPVAPAVKPAAEPDSGRKTVSQQEAESAAMKTTAEARAKDENVRYQDIMNKGAKANDMIANAKAVENIAKQPKMRAALGYFETPDGLSAIGKYMESKEKGEPVLRKIVTQYNAPQEVIDNLSVLETLLNNTTIEARRAAQGQGTITDREGPLYERVGPTTKDPYEAFMKKNRMLMERAKTQKELANALEASNMTADKFMRSQQYQNIIDAYIANLESIVGGTKSESKNPKASQKVRQELGL